MRILLLWFLLAVVPVRAETLAGVVIVVIDGDTLLFRPDHYAPASRAFLKVRLAGIDAPESRQPHGDAATQSLKALALRRRGELEIVATDVYGRKLGVLEVDGLQVNAELVRRGDAWASTRGRRDALHGLQDAARAAGRGLWADPGPMPPSQWRHAHIQN